MTTRAADTQTSTTLLNRVAEAGDEGACAAFVNRYGCMVRAIARHAGLTVEDAEDLGQEVMMAAVEALRQHRYDRQRGRFKVWLRGVIANKIADVRRAKRAIHPSRDREGPKAMDRSRDREGAKPRGCEEPLPYGRGSDLVDPHAGPAEEFEAAFEREWEKVIVEEALDEIRKEVEPLTFQAYDLVANKGLAPRNAAKLLGVSSNAVSIAKSRVLKRLQAKVAEASRAPEFIPGSSSPPHSAGGSTAVHGSKTAPNEP